ncbi:MAG: fumarylacetoacetate hydrolase family protein [Bacteroidales bacterium]|nr:fumarylacetoacetate hydrolase family protein [Bacteroidales bacterium]
MKIICIGLNYMDHIREMNNPIPQVPVFFLKPDTSLVRNNNPFFYPEFTNDLQYELEVVLKINKLGRNVSEKFAHRYYNEIGLGIDFTARDLQRLCKDKGMPWEMAKAFDGSAPISSFVQKDRFENLNNINFKLEKNDLIVQKGNTNDMVFKFDHIISYVTKFITLRTGDLIFTGTPVGVGPVKVGDRLKAYLEDELMLDFFIR